MYVKLSRLCMIIMASVFLGLSIGLYIINAVSTDPNSSTTIPAVCIVGMLILIAFLLVVQQFSNRAEKKAELKKELSNKTTNKEE